LLALATGIGCYTFIYARGGSYLTDDLAACATCHVTQDAAGPEQDGRPAPSP
jgi:cytochrome c nitrite reductase small subunit